MNFDKDTLEEIYKSMEEYFPYTTNKKDLKMEDTDDFFDYSASGYISFLDGGYIVEDNYVTSIKLSEFFDIVDMKASMDGISKLIHLKEVYLFIQDNYKDSIDNIKFLTLLSSLEGLETLVICCDEITISGVLRHLPKLDSLKLLCIYGFHNYTLDSDLKLKDNFLNIEEISIDLNIDYNVFDPFSNLKNLHLLELHSNIDNIDESMKLLKNRYPQVEMSTEGILLKRSNYYNRFYHIEGSKEQ